MFMKCDFSLSQDTSMSVDRYSLKFRILALVVNTANLINERTTPTFSISHAILAPFALTTTYIFLGVLVVGASKHKYASEFFQIYGLICCAALHISLSISVFKSLKHKNEPHSTHREVGIVLNGVLPMFTIILILADLIVLMFSKRDDISLPSSGVSSGSHPPSSAVPNVERRSRPQPVLHLETEVATQVLRRPAESQFETSTGQSTQSQTVLTADKSK